MAALPERGFSAERTFAPDEFEQIAGWVLLHVTDRKVSVVEHEPERVERFARSLGFKIDK